MTAFSKRLCSAQRRDSKQRAKASFSAERSEVGKSRGGLFARGRVGVRGRGWMVYADGTAHMYICVC